VPFDEEEMGLVAKIRVGRTGGDWGLTRWLRVEAAGKQVKCRPSLSLPSREVLVGVEHPGVEVTHGRGPGIAFGQEKNAGSEGSGGVGEDGPHESLGVPNGG
jgi:hypothetical protein